VAKLAFIATCAALLFLSFAARGQGTSDAPKAAYEPVLARARGADDNGMKRYVLVVLKTGPNKVPAGPERDEMFKGHFANMNRLAAAGKLALAGPFDGVDGWRGLFIFAVTDIAEAKALVATDPVVIKGEMVAEYHVHLPPASNSMVLPESGTCTVTLLAFTNASVLLPGRTLPPTVPTSLA
jgi:uncharacterized protein YciI